MYHKPTINSFVDDKKKLQLRIPLYLVLCFEIITLPLITIVICLSSGFLI